MNETLFLEFLEYSDEVDCATYDPDDNKIRLYSGRVDRELYDALVENGYRRAYKQGCFFATWTPPREDIALALCGEIVEEGSTLMDRAEARQSRFAVYSDNAAARSRQRHQAARDAVKHIPPGQPILVGHYSEKRHRADLKRFDTNMSKAVEESDRAKYWERRAQAVTRHASRKHAPGPTARRIKKLKAEVRRHQREIDPNGKRWLEDVAWFKSYHGWTDEQIAENWEHRIANAKRWLDHLEGQIAYWEAVYAESGGVSADRHGWEFKKGGWVRGRWGWGQVARVNKDRTGTISSVSVDKKTVKAQTGWMPHIIKVEEVRAYLAAWDDGLVLGIENALKTGQPLPKDGANE